MTIKSRLLAVSLTLAISFSVGLLLWSDDGLVQAVPELPTPGELIQRLPEGGAKLNAPVMYTLCGVPVVLIEPNNDGSMTSYHREDLKKRLQDMPETGILVNELTDTYKELSCTPGGNEYQSPRPPVPDIKDPDRMWSA